MRTIEAVTLCLGVVAWLWPGERNSLGARLAIGATVLALAIQLVWEGSRWQMFPAYLVVLVGIIGALWPRTAKAAPTQRRRVLRWTGRGLGVLGLGAAALLCLLLPVYRLPTPTGPYPIGRVAYHWVDQARPETLTPAAHDQRELNVLVWYPAAPAPKQPVADYIAAGKTAITGLATAMAFPQFLLDHFVYIHAHAYAAAPLATDGPYPVLLFSHGLGTLPELDTALLEELASQGYVVVGINHSYVSATWSASDGHLLRFDPSLVSTQEQEQRDALIALMTADVRYILTQLEQLNAAESSDRFTRQLDLRRVGVLGHSIGGAAAAEVCRVDARCQAGMVLDGSLGMQAQQAALAMPFMFLREEIVLSIPDADLAAAGMTREDAIREFNKFTGDVAFSHLQNDGYLLTLKNFAHYNFTDFALLSPLAQRIGLTGPVDGQHGLQLVNAYTRAFFDRYLKQTESPLLHAAVAEYPEVTFQARQSGQGMTTMRFAALPRR